MGLVDIPTTPESGLLILPMKAPSDVTFQDLPSEIQFEDVK